MIESVRQQLDEARLRAEQARDGRAHYDDALHRLHAMRESARAELNELSQSWPTLAAEAVLAGRPAMLETAEIRNRMQMLREFIDCVPQVGQVLTDKLSVVAQRLAAENQGINVLERQLRRAEIRDRATALMDSGGNVRKAFDALGTQFDSLTRIELAQALELKPGTAGHAELLRGG